MNSKDDLYKYTVIFLDAKMSESHFNVSAKMKRIEIHYSMTIAQYLEEHDIDSAVYILEGWPALVTNWN
jgi:hypothetical protein